MSASIAKKTSAFIAIVVMLGISAWLCATSGALGFIAYAGVCIYFPGKLLVEKSRNLSGSVLRTKKNGH